MPVWSMWLACNRDTMLPERPELRRPQDRRVSTKPGRKVRRRG